jgi:hypothetical protein
MHYNSPSFPSVYAFSLSMNRSEKGQGIVVECFVHRDKLSMI